ncbi:MAG: PfkB family carbohydrate kinase [Thiohalocapsa sp.]
MPFDRSQPPVVFGEVLFDCFPDGSRVLGGAPFNVAAHLAAFCAAPVFVSRVGNDALGDRIAKAMTDRGMSRIGLQRDPAHDTGTVEVTLSGGEPTYEIVADRAYDNIDAGALPALSGGGLLYHGSLALRNGVSATALRTLREALDAQIFLDVNLRSPWWDEQQVLAMIDAATWAKLNADELELLAPAGATLEERARLLLERHELELVIATQGSRGAFALSSDGGLCRVAPEAGVQVVDAVGAGDGFASVLILSLLRAWPLQQSLERAQSFASAMVGQRGATVEDPQFYAAFAKAWGL